MRIQSNMPLRFGVVLRVKTDSRVLRDAVDKQKQWYAARAAEKNWRGPEGHITPEAASHLLKIADENEPDIFVLTQIPCAPSHHLPVRWNSQEIQLGKDNFFSVTQSLQKGKDRNLYYAAINENQPGKDHFTQLRKIEATRKLTSSEAFDMKQFLQKLEDPEWSAQFQKESDTINRQLAALAQQATGTLILGGDAAKISMDK